jgi:hypothetical protein
MNMKKKILMIGDTSDLEGVPVDIRDYYEFFTSSFGGSWCHDEIDILRSPSRSELIEAINEIERADYDFLITIFSGHGAEAIRGTILQINGDGETIEADDLLGLSPRQISVFDCCRTCVDDDFLDEGATMFSMSRDSVRQAYEERI